MAYRTTVTTLVDSREILVGSVLRSVSLALYMGPGAKEPDSSPIACWLTTPEGSLRLSCGGVGLRIEKGEPEPGYSMDESGDVILQDGVLLPEIAAVVARRIDSVHGIYTAGTQDLLGIELIVGSDHLVVACWGDELTIGPTLQEDVRRNAQTP